MHLISVNLGRPEPIAAKDGLSGIFKRPQRDAVQIGRLGLVGDSICDRANHGGPDQAVYVYGQVDYDWWSEALGRTLAPGTFGENLTIAGFASRDACVGDRLVIGAVILETSAPRIPCAALARRMGDPGFVRRFQDAARPGVYCRVVREGAVRAGDAVAVQPYAGTRVSVAELMMNPARYSAEDARRLLSTPIHHKLRERLGRG